MMLALPTYPIVSLAALRGMGGMGCGCSSYDCTDSEGNPGVCCDPDPCTTGGDTAGVCVAGGDLGSNCAAPATPAETAAYCQSIGWTYNASDGSCLPAAGTGSGTGLPAGTGGGSGGTQGAPNSSGTSSFAPVGSGSGSGIGTGLCGVLPVLCTMGFLAVAVIGFVAYQVMKK